MMNKITKRMIKYVFLINLIVIVLGFFLTTTLLPKIYNENEFMELENASDYVIQALSENKSVDLANISVVLLTGDNVSTMCGGEKGQRKSIDFYSLKGKQIYKSKNGHTYITYKTPTQYGDLVVYKSYEGSENLIKSVNKLLIAVFSLSLIFSSFLAVYLGNRFTRPIIQIQKRAKNIAKGVFKEDYKISTNDEIEYLSDSIEEMASSLEKKDIMQKEFIANVSHDLKTPLSVIRANSEVIRDGLVYGEEVIKFSESIINEVDRLNNLVAEILSLSKLQDKNKIVNMENKNIYKFISESYKKIKCTNNIEDDIEFNLVINKEKFENIFININQEYLYRVLLNFFHNAINHSKTNKIDFIVLMNKDKIKIGIKDYGIGINNELLESIWERYHKGKDSGGMGLGLAISKEILQIHNFKYGIDSIEGRGSEFYFIIENFTVSSQITH